MNLNLTYETLVDWGRKWFVDFNTGMLVSLDWFNNFGANYAVPNGKGASKKIEALIQSMKFLSCGS